MFGHAWLTLGPIAAHHDVRRRCSRKALRRDIPGRIECGLVAPGQRAFEEQFPRFARDSMSVGDVNFFQRRARDSRCGGSFRMMPALTLLYGNESARPVRNGLDDSMLSEKTLVRLCAAQRGDGVAGGAYFSINSIQTPSTMFFLHRAKRAASAHASHGKGPRLAPEGLGRVPKSRA